ncbi:MAG: carbohydrate-binding family 9-like protein [Bacteroidales bacterium]|nr:carbohydrate-binding family 9-like protein [Bacteroidales bacterium]
MNKLTVPYVPELSGASAEKIVELMEIKAIRQSIDNVNWPEQFSYKPIASFSIARDEERIYLYYFVRGNSLRALYSEDLSEVWTDSCVEFFLQVPGDANYYNFEFNCIGTCYAAKRESRANFTLLTKDELSQIQRYTKLDKSSFQEKEGLFAWDLLVSIPFSLIGLEGANLPEKIRANFYKCADATIIPHFVSWNPIDTPNPDFHRPEFFGEIYF